MDDYFLDDPEELNSQALVQLLRQQQKRGELQRGQLEEQAGQQQAQASGLNSLALLSSFGDNPLLRNLQGEAGRQGAQAHQAGIERLRELGRGQPRQLSPGDILRGIGKPPPVGPDDPASKRLQGAVRAQYPNAPEELISAITPTNLESFRKMIGSGLDREQRGRLGAQRLGLDWARLSQDQKQFLSTMEFKEQELQDKKDTKLEEDTNTAAQDFGKELFKSGIPGAQAQVKQLEDLFTKYPKGLPGIGYFTGAIPNRFQGEDAKKVQMLIGQLGATYQKSMTGAGASDAERQRYDEVTGLLKRGDDESVRLGVRMMAEDLGVKAQALEAAYKPEAVKRVKDRTAGEPAAPTIDLGAPPPAAPKLSGIDRLKGVGKKKPAASAPEPGGTAIMTDPQGAQWEVSANEVAEAEKNGWKRVK